jgi:hypothetical protein
MEDDALTGKRFDRLLAIVVHSPSGRIPDLRTKLDEWKAFRDRGGLVTRGGRQRWFNNPCPWKEFARLRAHMDWITPSAEGVLALAEQRDPRVRKPKRGEPAPHRLIVEHAVPIKVLHDLIIGNTALWQVERLEVFLLANFKRGLLTSSEDALLNQIVAGQSRSLRQRMPTGWSVNDNDPYARYRTVGLAQHSY